MACLPPIDERTMRATYERVLARVAEALVEAGMEVERYRQWLTSPR